MLWVDNSLDAARMSMIENQVPDDEGTINASFNLLYSRLKTMAHRELNRSSGSTLNTTALVHELYIRMTAAEANLFPKSIKFFAYAATAMRHILIDSAMRRIRPKFGGRSTHIDIADADGAEVAISPEIALELDSALRELEQDDVRAARVVELHYFSGLSLDRVAELLGVVRRTVDRDWRYARAFIESRIR